MGQEALSKPDVQWWLILNSSSVGDATMTHPEAPARLCWLIVVKAQG